MHAQTYIRMHTHTHSLLIEITLQYCFRYCYTVFSLTSHLDKYLVIKYQTCDDLGIKRNWNPLVVMVCSELVGKKGGLLASCYDKH